MKIATAAATISSRITIPMPAAAFSVRRAPGASLRPPSINRTMGEKMHSATPKASHGALCQLKSR